MFFWKRNIDTGYGKLAEKIKKDLSTTLQRRGVNVSKIKIDINADSMNVCVYVAQN